MKFEINLDYKALLEQIKHLETLNNAITDLVPIIRILTEIRRQMEQIPEDYWDTVEEYLPNYDSRGDVLSSNILNRYFNDEEVSNDDSKWIADIGTGYERGRYHIELYTKLYYEALIFKNANNEKNN